MEWLIEFIDVRGEYNEIINWLIDNVEDVRERQFTKGEFYNKPKPFHFSAVSQFARFRGITNQWYLEIRGNNQLKTVRFSEAVDPCILTKFALKYTIK